MPDSNSLNKSDFSTKRSLHLVYWFNVSQKAHGYVTQSPADTRRLLLLAVGHPSLVQVNTCLLSVWVAWRSQLELHRA